LDFFRLVHNHYRSAIGITVRRLLRRVFMLKTNFTRRKLIRAMRIVPRLAAEVCFQSKVEIGNRLSSILWEIPTSLFENS
jgi:hypothetical protein